MNREIAKDLQCIARQEQLLQFTTFDKATAWELGSRLKQACEAANVATTIEVRLNRRTVFLYAMPGTAPDNADWARRKRNVVEMMDRSSYAVGLAGEEQGISMELAMGLPVGDYASHGGAFPLKVKGVGCIGVVTVSGLPSREDHSLLVRVLAQMCAVAEAQVALPAE